MNHPVSQVAGQLLAAAGFGKWGSDPTRTVADWQITYGETLPDDGDTALGISDVEGENENFRSLKDGTPSIRPGITIQFRALDDATAAPKAWAVAKYLDGVFCAPVTLGGTTYRVTNVSRKYDPCFLMEEDRSERRIWIFRALITLRME